MTSGGASVRRVWESEWLVPAALWGLLAACAVFAGLVFPELLERAYRGEGPAWLARQLSDRGTIPLEEYLADGRALGIRAGAMLALLALLASAWARRGRSVAGHLLEPAPLRDLAVLRAVVVGLQLALLLWPGVVLGSPASDPTYQALLTHAPAGLYDPPLASRLFLPGIGRPGPELVWGIWTLAVGSAVAGLLGLFGRAPLVLLAWANTVLVAHTYSYGEYHHTEAIHSIALWLVALAPSTGAFSVDAFRRRLRDARGTGGFRPSGGPRLSPHARWPMVLLGLVFAVTYLDAAVEKLLIGGLEWFDPRTMAYFMAVDGTRFDMPIAMWLSQHPGLVAPFAAGAWAIEFLFPVALVSALLAAPIVLLAVAMHVAIWAVHGPPFLQHAILLPATFLDPLRTAWRRLRKRAPGRLRVLYDGHCDLCTRSMVALETLDLTDRVQFLDLEDEREAARLPEVDRAAALARIHVADEGGRVWQGFAAVRRVCRTLPALWLLLPLLHAPGSGRLGPALYDAVARRRNRRGCRLTA